MDSEDKSYPCDGDTAAPSEIDPPVSSSFIAASVVIEDGEYEAKKMNEAVGTSTAEAVVG